MNRIVDLTLNYNNDLNGFSKTPAKTIDKDGWNASTLTFYSHSGTHMDAPIHFNVSTQTIDKIPVSDFVGRAWIVDVRNIGSKGLITAEHIEQSIKKQFKKGDSLIFWTGWSQFINTPKYRDELPRISRSLALWCLDNEVKMLGVEGNVNSIKNKGIKKIADKNCIPIL